MHSVVPLGLNATENSSYPTFKRLGYCQTPLRDKGKILVALCSLPAVEGVLPAARSVGQDARLQGRQGCPPLPTAAKLRYQRKPRWHPELLQYEAVDCTWPDGRSGLENRF